MCGCKWNGTVGFPGQGPGHLSFINKVNKQMTHIMRCKKYRGQLLHSHAKLACHREMDLWLLSKSQAWCLVHRLIFKKMQITWDKKIKINQKSRQLSTKTRVIVLTFFEQQYWFARLKFLQGLSTLCALHAISWWKMDSTIVTLSRHKLPHVLEIVSEATLVPNIPPSFGFCCCRGHSLRGSFSPNP